MSAPSLGVVTHVYREAHTLPTFLKMASAFFDEIVVMSTPPSGAPPDDETVQIAKDFGVRVVFSTIDAGFGVVRTRCIRESSCEYVAIMDADEHFAVEMPTLACHGDRDYPQHKNPGLTTTSGAPIVNQRSEIRRILAESKADALRLKRRHWFDAPGEYKLPCQSWVRHPDYQLRLVKNDQFIYFDPAIKMHEQLRNSRTQGEPSWIDVPNIYWEHAHFWAKERDPVGREIALRTYTALDSGSTDLMWTRVGFEDQAPNKESE